MSDATLVDGDRPAVRLERHLPHPPADVWRAVTDREELRSWFPCDVEVIGGSWVPGAAIRFRFPPEVVDLTLTGEVLEVEEPWRLAFTWGEEVLRLELVPEGSGTRFVLVDELPAAFAARNAAGWEECLDRLEGHEPPSGGWTPRFEAYSAAFAPVLGPQEGPPVDP